MLTLDASLDDEQRTALLLEQMAIKPVGICTKCGADMTSHEVVITHAMGFKDRFTCATCIARGLGKPKNDFLEHVLKHISHRECFLQAWKWASRFHGLNDNLRPAHLFPEPETASSIRSDDTTRKFNASSFSHPLISASEKLTPPNAIWDAGDMGCGDLVLELRVRLTEMAAGELLEVRATDPGAPEDIPAWCGMTGHGLVSTSHPLYMIRRRERP
jgi:tRNA 2-thiouridine synthesizing protein A